MPVPIFDLLTVCRLGFVGTLDALDVGVVHERFGVSKDELDVIEGRLEVSDLVSEALDVTGRREAVGRHQPPGEEDRTGGGAHRLHQEASTRLQQPLGIGREVIGDEFVQTRVLFVVPLVAFFDGEGVLAREIVHTLGNCGAMAILAVTGDDEHVGRGRSRFVSVQRRVVVRTVRVAGWNFIRHG
jgi:hypothetical protein